MSNSLSLDPSFQLAKVFIRIGMVFSALMVALFIYLIYLASLGIFQEWDMEIQSTFSEFQFEISPFIWQLATLSIPIIGFIVSFFLLFWLGKKIQAESRGQHLEV
ncbi:hypothetical protein U3A58_04100 [Algoriphagus sp. C2-6-M1]|uniref:hypothetical protein n=1 Tax=Algoriphagus persicinus TaxID=3108754 RepID=UPI002B380448|nr:hypothetical protein [Algoriphagus sp. C2-6-M1]MEB2779567.1 hypothetical protein [Algoriphagus sp. C2-6-M1]